MLRETKHQDEVDSRFAVPFSAISVLAAHSCNPRNPWSRSAHWRKPYGSSTFSVVHCGGDVEFTDGEVEHGD